MAERLFSEGIDISLYSSTSGAVRKNQKWKEMKILQSCSQLDKVWHEMHACWPWQNSVDRFVSTMGKLHSSTHLS